MCACMYWGDEKIRSVHCIANQIAYNNAKKNENIIIDCELGVDREI